MNKKVILHIDINSYFATLLQQENPYLRAKPIGVVKNIGRTCVIAASKEAKKYGVRTGSNVVEAKQSCPNIIFLAAEFDRYLAATKRLKRLFSRIAPNVYIYSLDEAFIDISNCGTLYPNPYHLAQAIQEKIKSRLGEWVTCNIGISHNRFLAKLASETAPKGTICQITQRNKDFYLASAPFENVCGIGFRLQKKLARMGATSLYQLRFFRESDLVVVFGPFWARELIKMAWGEEPHHLELLARQQPHMQSVGRSVTGFKLCHNESEIKAILHNLTEEVVYKARKMRLSGRYVAVHLWGQTASWKAHKTLKYYLNHANTMFNLLYYQLYKSWRRSFPIIKFAVRLGLLQPTAELSSPLLLESQKQEKLAVALDKLSDKYGLFVVKPASLLGRPLIRPEVTGFFGDRIYQIG